MVLRGQMRLKLDLVFICALCLIKLNCVQVEGDIIPFFSKMVHKIRDLVRDPTDEIYMSTPELIAHHGYPVEEHKVLTDDGYILTVFRIPHGKETGNSSSTPVVQKEPVLLQHGVLCSSNDWLLIPPEDILPYLLADAGHDVWLGNNRGNNYSQEHLTLTVSDPEFYDFSFEETGKYDLPAVVQYILNATEQDQLSYVGHSMGTTNLFVGLNEHEDLHSKIRKAILMAPAVYLNNFKSPFFRILQLVPTAVIQPMANWISDGRFIPSEISALLKTLGPNLCHDGVPRELCNNFLFLIAGFDYDQTTNRTASMIAGHTPSETSAKTFVHFSQNYYNDRFAAFDYEASENWRRYNSTSPRMYSLAKVKVPTLVMYGLNDLLIDPLDAMRVIDELGNVSEFLAVDYPYFSHMDFLYAKDVKKLVYLKCLDFLAKSN